MKKIFKKIKKKQQMLIKATTSTLQTLNTSTLTALNTFFDEKNNLN